MGNVLGTVRGWFGGNQEEPASTPQAREEPSTPQAPEEPVSTPQAQEEPASTPQVQPQATSTASQEKTTEPQTQETHAEASSKQVNFLHTRGGGRVVNW